MSRRGAAAGLLALAAACGETTDVSPIDLSLDGRHVGVVVRTGADGEATTVDGPFGVQDGRLWFGQRPQFGLADGLGAWVAVMPVDELTAARPGFTVDRIGTLEVVDATAPAEQAQRDGTLLGRAPFPASTRLWRVESGRDPRAISSVDPERDAFTGRWQLGLPFDPEHCRDTLGTSFTEWDVFAALRPLEGPELNLDLRRVAALDRDRVLAATATRLFVVDRSRPLRPEELGAALPARTVAMRTLWPEATEPVLTAVVTPPSPAPALEALALIRGTEDGREQTRLVRLRVSADGLTEVRTSTTLPGDLDRLAIDEARRFALPATEGRVYFGALNTDDLSPVTIPDAEGERFRGVLATGDPEAPWLVTGRSSAYERLAGPNGRWTQTILSRVGESLRLRALAAAGPANGRQRWAGGTSGVLYARRDGVWARAMPALPPRFGVCGNLTDAPRPEYRDGVDALDITDGALTIVSDDCFGLVRIRLSDGCSAVLTLAERRIGRTEGAVRALSSRDGQLVGVGSGGRVWSLD